MSSRLIHSLSTTDTLASAFADRTFVQAMFDFEAALARAGAQAGLVPAQAADSIALAAVADDVDVDELVHQARAGATVAIPVVELLEARVAAIDAEAARWVHFGATSQDVVDTALVLCLRVAWPSIEVDHARITDALRRLSDAHADTVMLGRTLLQPAAPITFGLKVAGWLGALSRSWQQWHATYDDVTVLQFGGATGTLAALGGDAVAVERALAEELDLTVPSAPWHSQRDRMAAFVAACGIYTGVLGKIARDVSLLMQHEVSEASEPGGGSSTMPHKRNPSGCATALAAAARLPGLVATMIGALTQEHERAVGGWHAEAPVVSDAVQTAGSALSAMADVIESLRVDPARMRENIESTRGVIFAERARLALAPSLGRQRAAALVKQAVAMVREKDVSFADAVASIPELAAVLPPGEVADPAASLGSAETFRRRLLAAATAAAAQRRR